MVDSSVIENLRHSITTTISELEASLDTTMNDEDDKPRLAQHYTTLSFLSSIAPSLASTSVTASPARDVARPEKVRLKVTTMASQYKQMLQGPMYVPDNARGKNVLDMVSLWF